MQEQVASVYSDWVWVYVSYGLSCPMMDKLHLQWDEFKQSIAGAFRTLREEKDFADVTLVCEDGEMVEVHKVVLAASSSFFKNILKRNKQAAHPLIYMRGVKSDDILAILDFLYRGEANVYQENLGSFLAIAEELQLEGMLGGIENREMFTTSSPPSPPPRTPQTPPSPPPQKIEKFTKLSPQKVKTFTKCFPKEIPPTNRREASLLKSAEPLQSKFAAGQIDSVGVGPPSTQLRSPWSENLKELDRKCNAMMQKTSEKKENGKPLYSCKICGKEDISGNIKQHIEKNHLERVSIACNACDKTFKSRSSLTAHNNQNHQEL